MGSIDGMSPRVRGLADKLRSIILATKAGALVGQENQLCIRLACTRSMLRQASRILEFQGLLNVRRGVRGGYYSARPSAEAVVATAALYFETRKTTLEEVMRATMAFTSEAIRLACKCPQDHPARLHLSRVRAELATKFPEDMDAFEFASDEVKVDEVIFEMVNNAPLELLIKILNRISVHEFGERLFVRQPARRIAFRTLRIQQVDALLAADAAGAVDATERLIACVLEWMAYEADLSNPIPRDSSNVIPLDSRAHV